MLWLSEEFVPVFLELLSRMIDTWVAKSDGYQESLQTLHQKDNLSDRIDDVQGLLKLNLAFKVDRNTGFHEFRKLEKWVDLFENMVTKEDVYFLTTYVIAEMSTILSKRQEDRACSERFRDTVIPSYLRDLRVAGDIFDYYTGVYKLDEIHLSLRVEAGEDGDPEANYQRQRLLIEGAMR